MTHRSFAALVCVGATLALGCGESSPSVLVPNDPDPIGQPPAVPSPPAPRGGDAVAGRAAFLSACSGCHTSRDGFDLAFFGFTDATILRRAAPHVDSVTARDILAHVRTLDVAGTAPATRPFQPGGAVLPNDLAFGLALFGEDRWPADLTSAGLRAVDPRELPVALTLPLWSVEGANLDWMPDSALPLGILERRARGETVRDRLAAYYASPSLENLVSAVTALRAADRAADDPAAPCVMEPPGRLEGVRCFDVRRWTSTLVAQHLLRSGLGRTDHPLLHDVWWDVGNAARQSPAGTLANREANWAAWMYLGWSFEPSRHASVYLGNALVRLGLARHATFVALRAQVARPAGRVDPYADLLNAARFAPREWTAAVLAFGYRELLARVAAGDVPPLDQITEARDRARQAFSVGEPKVPASERAPVAALRDALLASLPMPPG